MQAEVWSALCRVRDATCGTVSIVYGKGCNLRYGQHCVWYGTQAEVLSALCRVRDAS